MIPDKDTDYFPQLDALRAIAVFFVLLEHWVPGSYWFNLFLQSVRHNKLNNVTARVIDWNELQGIPVPDTLLLSDINYEPAQFEKLFAAIGYFLDRHCTIILSTPQRLVARDFINQLLPFCKEQAVRTIATESGTTEISIFVLKQ